MKSSIETLSPTRVRLAIEVPFAELEPSLKKAYRDIAAQVTIPGFRRGKVPTAVIDQRFGRGTVLNEAVQDAIPNQFLAAVRAMGHDVEARPGYQGDTQSIFVLPDGTLIGVADPRGGGTASSVQQTRQIVR